MPRREFRQQRTDMRFDLLSIIAVGSAAVEAQRWDALVDCAMDLIPLLPPLLAERAKTVVALIEAENQPEARTAWSQLAHELRLMEAHRVVDTPLDV